MDHCNCNLVEEKKKCCLPPTESIVSIANTLLFSKYLGLFSCSFLLTRWRTMTVNQRCNLGSSGNRRKGQPKLNTTASSSAFLRNEKMTHSLSMLCPAENHMFLNSLGDCQPTCVACLRNGRQMQYCVTYTYISKFKISAFTLPFLSSPPST